MGLEGLAKKIKFFSLQSAKTLAITAAVAGLAQLVERFVYTEDVGSSSLSSRTIHFTSPAAPKASSAAMSALPSIAASKMRRRL